MRLLPGSEREIDLLADSEVIRQWSGSSWEIVLEQAALNIKTNGKIERIPFDGTIELDTKRLWMRWHLIVESKSRLRLKGLSRFEAKLLAISFELGQSRIWSSKLRQVLEEHRGQHRWIPQETIDNLIETKPSFLNQKTVERLGIMKRLNIQEVNALNDLELNLINLFEDLNQTILAAELTRQKTFLDSIESKPLSSEQATAVLTFDNRVLLVAAAGSGKTSVMVARAAYASMKGIVEPSRILLLAFNKAAAEELQERVREGFARVNIDSSGIKSSTFHAYGLEVIGRAMNARPKVAPWVETSADLDEVASIVKMLKDTSKEFNYKWDLYRLIFPPETMKIAGSEPDSWDSESRERGFRTFDGKIVRSHGERMIANWLFLNGVSYQYERDYKVDTTDAYHRQYTPDFYYPDIDTWHEHWALDKNGNPPPDFSGYRDDILWKRNLHSVNKTDLIETTFGGVVFGNGLTALEENLVRRGITMNWDPDRPKAAFTNIDDSEVIKLIRTFMSHVKSNSLTGAEIASRLQGKWSHLKSRRADLFLEIYWLIHQEWNRRLGAANAIDFEDMLIQAAHLVESEAHVPEYDLVLVDEFQDSSSARARLIKSLLQSKGRFILAVGDDWQSINRFAGADVSLMSNFHDYFGKGPTLRLSRTYRCTQTIADVATKFVTKNPRQITKQVLADEGRAGNPIILIRTLDAQNGVKDALRRILEDLKANGRTSGSVFILGRYNFNRDWAPNEDFPGLRIMYRTIHGSKGLEADYVVVVNLESGLHGFPSEIEDDPILNLAMSHLETFEYSEERRLLYVALTRAKNQVFLVTRQNRDSMFAVELMSDSLLEVVTLDAAMTKNPPIQTCKVCNKGVMVIRSGPYSKFLGCSRFPKCANKSSIH